MPVHIGPNSQMSCEKSPSAYPFFTAGPECGLWVEPPLFQRRPTQRQVRLCRFFVSAAVRYPQFDSSPCRVHEAQVFGSLEERIISDASSCE
jgi:hypothetical protein